MLNEYKHDEFLVCRFAGHLKLQMFLGFFSDSDENKEYITLYIVLTFAVMDDSDGICLFRSCNTFTTYILIARFTYFTARFVSFACCCDGWQRGRGRHAQQYWY